ncbi:hypothetical protein MAMC_02001 [Methylacidimicrobium cyclopophantes]|uniref:Uncharacterized protein n=1 Tax=Methylacidimicrobium cyclopophantes TaxID=1041766 RepID=A0A5E6MFW9_9BACT|nr:hypothetical protein [Methylacidimicrobium cyclopophantes]VVM08170.1 hypothetical protein MAMC_02001 [Methylacidimicrobium cyclopophantes]
MKELSGWKGWAALLLVLFALAAAGNWGATEWKRSQERNAVVKSFRTDLARSLPQADALRGELVRQKLLLENLLAQGEAATKSQGIPTDLLQTASARFRELLDRASALANQIQTEADQAAARLGLASSDSLFPSSTASSWRAFLTEINEDRQWEESARQRIALLEERWTMLAAREQAPAIREPGLSPEDYSVPPPDVPATNPPPEDSGIGSGSPYPFVGDTEATTTYGGGYGGYPWWGWGGWGMGWGMGWGLWGWGFFPFFPLIILEQSNLAQQIQQQQAQQKQQQQQHGGAAANRQAAVQSRDPSHSAPAAHHGLTQHGVGHGSPANATARPGGLAHSQASSPTASHGTRATSALAHGGFPSQTAVHPQHLFSPAVHDIAGRSVNTAALHGANLSAAAHAHGFSAGSVHGAGSFVGHTGFPHTAGGGFHGASGLAHGGAFHGAGGFSHGGVFHGAGGAFHGSPNVFHGASLGAGGFHGVGGFHGMPGGFHGMPGGFHGGMGGFHGGFGGFHGGGGHR